MCDDDWGDGPTETPTETVSSSFSSMSVSNEGGGSEYRGRGGRGGRGRGGFSGDRDFQNRGDDGEGGRGGYRGRGGGRGRGGYNRDESRDGDEEDGEGKSGGYRGRGGGRGFRRDNEDRNGGSDDEGGGRGGYRGGRGGGRGRGGGNFGDRDQENNVVEGGDGEAEEKPKERYCPPEMLEGDSIFEERNQVYEGSGINFSKYESIAFEINGRDPPKAVDSFEALGLRKLLLENVVRCGYTKPTPIQKHASPVIINGRDVMACAQTGSGKTAGYLLPILNLLLNDQADLSGAGSQPVTPECLILAPTRELAIQIGKEANMYANQSIIKSRVIYGGTAIFHQKQQLFGGCNILVATPGRLLQFVKESHVSLEKTKYFVLDEADRMLDMGFMGDVKTLVESLPAKGERVSAMFSATFPVPIQKAASEFLNDYIFVVIGVVGGACTDVKQEFILAERAEKRGKLMEILRDLSEEDKVLVFCASKKGADYLAANLSTQGISTTSIHGDRLQSQREQALHEFTTGKRKVLVATSVAARGLDIPKVSIVVNFDLPSEIDEYVHRIGRTGRVGHTGRAISFYDEAQDGTLAPQLVGILEGANQPVPEFLGSEVGGLGSGIGGSNGFAATDIRSRGMGTGQLGAPACVEVEEEDWD